jgi:cytochrome c oxidase subunit 3
MTGHVAHHFDDAEQQFHAANLGMWIFLATEVMFFGSLFAAYTAYRYMFPEAFVAGSHSLDVVMGTINTAVLLLSSLFVALAVNAAATNRSRAAAGFLVGAIVMGVVFLGIKAVEYADKFEHNHVPGQHFQFHHDSKGEHPVSMNEDASHGGDFQAGHNSPDRTLEKRVELFFSLYFAMTGLHALHMVIGVVLLGIVAYQAWRGAYSQTYFTPVEVSGLYWHFVDIVWVFLFPLLYLIR